jgi:hypothetical protein
VTAAEDPRLTRAGAIRAAFPEATTERSGRHATFPVRAGRSRAPSTTTTAEPDRSHRPAGARGWVGPRLDDPVDRDEVTGLVTTSNLLIAPRRLAARISRRG